MGSNNYYQISVTWIETKKLWLKSALMLERYTIIHVSTKRPFSKTGHTNTNTKTLRTKLHNVTTRNKATMNGILQTYMLSARIQWQSVLKIGWNTMSKKYDICFVGQEHADTMGLPGLVGLGILGNMQKEGFPRAWSMTRYAKVFSAYLFGSKWYWYLCIKCFLRQIQSQMKTATD